MRYRSVARLVPFCHTLWRVLPLLCLVAAASNVLCAANAPRFAFTFKTNAVTGPAVAVDSIGNSYLTGSVTETRSLRRLKLRIPERGRNLLRRGTQYRAACRHSVP